MNIHFYTAFRLDAESGNPFEGSRPKWALMLTEDEVPTADEDDEVDPFAELGVAAPAEAAEAAGDALEAFFEDEDDEDDKDGQVVEAADTPVVEAPDEDEDDPFEALGVASPGEAAEAAGDALDAFFDDDDDDEAVVEVEAPSVAPKSSSLDDYRMVLQTVWVDGILDPAEVALLARRRAEAGISFEQHLDLVRELLE